MNSQISAIFLFNPELLVSDLYKTQGTQEKHGRSRKQIFFTPFRKKACLCFYYLNENRQVRVGLFLQLNNY